MEYTKDILKFSSNFPILISCNSGRDFNFPLLHWHDCVELNCVLKGRGTYIINNVQYDMVQGDIFVINNKELHYAFSDGSLDLLVIAFEPAFICQNSPFDYEYLKPFLDRKQNFCNRIGSQSEVAQIIAHSMADILEEKQNERDGFKLVIKSVVMKILALLYRYHKEQGELGNDVLEHQQRFEKLEKAVEYINKNFMHSISLDTAAGLVYMNPSYFSDYFRKVMQTTVTEYITSLRINHALQLLKTTSHRITEISMACGFESISHFNRVFKKLTGLSPSEYRRNV